MSVNRVHLQLVNKYIFHFNLQWFEFDICVVSIKTLINNLCQGLNSNSIIISVDNKLAPCHSHLTGHSLNLLHKILKNYSRIEDIKNADFRSKI